MFTRNLSLSFTLQALLLGYSCGMDQNFDVFKNKDGQTPCTLTDQLIGNCPSKRDVIVNSFDRANISYNISFPAPTECSCNLVFFNLWSACLYTNGSNVYPIFDNLTTQCTQKSIQPDQSLAWIKADDQIQLPSWAWIPTTQNNTFDIEGVLEMLQGPKKWTAIQMAIPFIATTGCVIILISVYFCYRKKVLKKIYTKNWLRVPWRRTRVVRAVDRNAVWTIDPDNYSPISESFVFVEPLSPDGSFMGPSRWSESSRVSTTEELPPLSERLFSIRKKEQRPRQPSRPGRNLRDRVRGLSLPWNTGPIRVRQIPRTKQFRVDEYDKSTDSSSSRPSTFTFSNASHDHGETTENGMNFYDTIHEDPDEDGQDLEMPNQAFDDSVTERETLISPVERDENSVFLISRNPGTDFTLESGTSDNRQSTVNSHVHVVPPTPISARQSVGMKQPIPPRLPPAPITPPPPPPNIPRRISPRMKKPSERDSFSNPSNGPSTLNSRRDSHVRALSDPLSTSTHHHGTNTSNPYSGELNRDSASEHFALLSPPRVPMHLDSDSSSSYYTRTHSPRPSTDANVPSLRQSGPRNLLSPSPTRREFVVDENPSQLRRPSAGQVVIGEHSVQRPPRMHGRTLSADDALPYPADPMMLYHETVRGPAYASAAINNSTESFHTTHSYPYFNPHSMS